MSRTAAVVAAALLASPPVFSQQPKPIKVLFLGDNGPHKPAERFRQLQPVFAKRGIDLVYTDKAAALNPMTLAAYDGLVIYANTTEITPEQEAALLDFVEGGKGFVPLHCASYCFLNSPKYVELVGAQFQKHGTGTVRTTVAAADHPVMKGFGGFQSWDETYVHTKHNDKDRTVLELREKEPWTWVRTQGKGRVFYTAWGHDERTWGNPGFHNLVERGVRWACGGDPGDAPGFVDRPETTAPRKDVKPFEYVEANVPFYPAGQKWGTIGEPIKRMQKPLSVEESAKHYVTPVGFEARPFVTEEKLGGKPIAMTWDERGRLWVSVTFDYPNELQPEGKGRDRLVVCEDSDGDGVCDKVATFADKLSIPTSLLNYGGGVVVTQAPHTLFLKDTDGDGTADLRQVLFTGWGTQDTHAGPSNLRYGFDNWVYGIVGYSGFVGTVGGEKHNFRQGFYRFKVEKDLDDAHRLRVTKLEFLRSTNNNSWGVGFSEEGLLFGSTANGCPSVFLAVPNRYYEKARGLTASVLPSITPDNHYEPITDKVRQVDWHGGFTSAAGHALYTARTYPAEYWNRTAFVSDPTGHLTATFVLQPDGAAYTARYGWNLLASDDEWASPIDAQVGPDGHVWVLDWYNFIVQHNPTPAGFKTGKGNAYETELRDKKHGRVYRVVYTKAGPEPRVDLNGATPAKLVEALKHPNMTWRLHAQRLLVESGAKDIGPALAKLVEDKSVDAAGLNVGAVHALHALDGLGLLGANDQAGREAFRAGVAHPSEAVRQAAWRGAANFPEAFSLAGYAGVDYRAQSPMVKLALLLAAADLPPERVSVPPSSGRPPRTLTSYLLDALNDPATLAAPALRDALIAAASVHDADVLYAIEPKATLPAEGWRVVEAAAANFAARGDQPRLSPILQRLMSLETEQAGRIITGLAAGWPANRPAKLTPEADQAVGQLLAKLPAAPRGRLLKLAAAWGSKGADAQLAEVVKGLLATATDEKAAGPTRLEAARQAVELRPEDETVVAKLIEAATGAPPELATGLFDALAGSKAKGGGSALVAALKDLTPDARAAALRVVLARPESVRSFFDAVEAGQARFDMLALDQKAALAGHPDRAIAARAKKLLAQGGGLPDPNRQKVIEEFTHLLKKAGDTAAGKKAFVQHCAKCHRHGDEGQTVGPDLTGMAAHPKEELLIHLLDPSRSVEGNFRVYIATRNDGRVLTGLLASESKTAVELVDAEGKRHPLSRADLEELRATDKSLMPEGFEKQMSAAELTDLMEFLTRRGKYLPLPLDKVASIVSTRGMFYDENAAAERLIFDDWKPRTVEGVPFVLTDPQGERVPNVVLLYGPVGKFPPKMPKSVTLPCNGPVRAVHLLSGISGWGFPYSQTKSVSMTVRLHYADGKTEDHDLKNGEHFADYIRRVDVPGSKFVFDLDGRQVRYLAVYPKRSDKVEKIELVKGPDRSAPVVVAVTVEAPE